MMDTMRKLAKGFIAKTLLLFLVLSFAIWGVGDVLRGSSANHVAKVGNTSIAPQEFQRETHKVRQIMQSMGMQPLPQGMLEDDVLRRLVQQRLIQHWADESSIVITREALIHAIQIDPKFLDVMGKFDPKTFANTLASQNISESFYLSEKTKELTNQVMVDSIGVADIHLSPAAKELAIRAAAQTRDGVLITLPAPKISDRVAAGFSQEELQSAYKDHAQNFMQPELRTLEYVHLNTQEIEKRVTDKATDAALKEAQVSDPSLTRENFLAQTREAFIQDLGMQVEDALAAGKNIPEILAELNISGTSKLLESIRSDQFDASEDPLLPEIAKQGFSLEEGTSSGLLSTPDGRFFLVSVKAITPPAPQPFDAVVPDLRRILTQQKATQAVNEKAAALKKALSEAKPKRILTDWARLLHPLQVSTRRVNGIIRPVQGKPSTLQKNLPPLLQQAAFEHGIGELVGPATRPDGTQEFLLLTAFHQPKATLSEEAQATLDSSYQNALEMIAMNALFIDLSTRHPVQINAPLLNQMVEGGAQ